MTLLSLRPFLPCKDEQASKSFYAELGFHIESAGPNLSLCTMNDCVFFLQNFYNEELANNLMLQLIVDDINEYFKLLSGIQDIKIQFSDIKHEAWGKVIYLWGPSGELWHVTELN